MNNVDTLHRVADESGGKVYNGYSGRGMYGETCMGISCDNATECIEAAAANGLRGAKTDDLGRGYIVYWPKIKAVRP